MEARFVQHRKDPTERLRQNRGSLASHQCLPPALIAARARAVGPGHGLMRSCPSADCGSGYGWLDPPPVEGFRLEDQGVDDREVIRSCHGVPSHLASCHTAVLTGSGIEGQVPAVAVRRSLPLASPAMESPLRRAFERVEA
ncbi:MAG: DUF411 domain-containing protein [Synechococcaceae cyanobacterium]|nr:DUF411 domain-containing protein [Synechococcaceae cyanobacterium]